MPPPDHLWTPWPSRNGHWGHQAGCSDTRPGTMGAVREVRTPAPEVGRTLQWSRRSCKKCLKWIRRAPPAGGLFSWRRCTTWRNRSRPLRAEGPQPKELAGGRVGPGSEAGLGWPGDYEAGEPSPRPLMRASSRAMSAWMSAEKVWTPSATARRTCWISRCCSRMRTSS